MTIDDDIAPTSPDTKRDETRITIPEVVSLTRETLARTAWRKTGADASGFDAWWATRIKAVSTNWHGSFGPTLLAVAAWNGARGRDSLAPMPPDDGAAFESWYLGFQFRLILEPGPTPESSLVARPPSIEVEDRQDRQGRSGDQFFFSPDVGRLVRRDGFLYTQYGQVLPTKTSFVRMMPVDPAKFENYADWTEAHRRQVLEAYERQWRLEEIEETIHDAYQDQLANQARTKLTDEEFGAVYGQGVRDGRGY